MQAGKTSVWLLVFISNGLFHAKRLVDKPIIWGWAPSQRICRSHQTDWHDSSMTRKTRLEHTEKKKAKVKGSASIQERLITFVFLFLVFSNLPGREYCSHAYKLAAFLVGLYRQATATARRTEQLGAQLESYSPGTGTLASHWLRRTRREQMLKLLSCGVFASFSVCGRRSHTMLRFGLYPMGDGARIKYAVGAALPRARLVQPRAKRKTKRKPREDQDRKNNSELFYKRSTHF